MFKYPLACRPALVLVALMLALIKLAYGQSDRMPIIHGTVVSVVDGDTLMVLDSHKVMHKIGLWGLDAPEKMQPFGRKSKFSLSDLTLLKQVDVTTRHQLPDGRTLGVVLVQGDDVNLSQLKRGMAWLAGAEPNQPVAHESEAYALAQAQAKASRRGLWGLSPAVPPWQFRQDNILKPLN